ncbi:MAG: hypothetical protein H5U05_05680 [Candidatus Aminicenantes bacterium]|nr:hypothetical protein [Candidatus Aminicenantes bacterium]
MTAALKNEKIKFFRSEESFCRYLDWLTQNKGYVLVETSPLPKSRAESASRSSLLQGQAERNR